MKVLVAGGTGVIGKPLIAQLRAAGHEALSLGRKAGDVRADALDAAAVKKAIAGVRPDVLVHQLTAIPPRLDPKRIDRDYALTNRLRTEGTRNLVDAAKEAGVRRFVAQSVAFLAPPGEGLASEREPVWSEGSCYVALGGALADLETQTMSAGFEQALVCRYGLFWGPGTVWDRDGAMIAGLRKRRLPVVGKGEGRFSFIHVDDAAAATIALMDKGVSGVFHVAEDEVPTAGDALRLAAQKLGAKKPWRVPRWIGRLGAGRFGVHMMTAMRGASNAAAKAQGWAPRRAFMRDFPDWR